MDQIRVSAPATVSNVVCGFDCLGFALAEPSETINVRRITERTVRIIHHDDLGLPRDPRKNVAGIALLAMMRAADLDFGFEVEMTKQIKPGSGIGSSAASSCGTVFAANRILGDRFSELELIEFALVGEELASGSKHADNVAPCILGGFTLVRSTEQLDIVKLDFPPLYATVIHPQIEIRTADARAILPRDVPLAAAARQWANLGAFVSGLASGDYALIARAMEDLIIEPVRKTMIPKFDELRSTSISAGALGGGISGSGPSVFMLSQTANTASNVMEAMNDVYADTNIEFKIYSSEVSSRGVRVL
jgi:homoserine kinase